MVCTAITAIVLKNWSKPDASDYTIDFATTLGVFGTFVGIVVGLYDFNPSNLESSVPKLLSGLKTAFLTSVAGMFGSMVVKFRAHQMGADAAAPSAEAAIAQLATTQAALLSAVSAYSRDSLEKMNSIEAAIIGDGDSTMHTQIIKIRTTLLDKHDELIKEFRSFSAQMAKSNSEALIDALKEVIRDFNTKINEQFGDNFKQLNQAVGQLLQWQDQYKGQVESMVAQFEVAAKGIEVSRVTLADIVEKSSAYTESAVHLKEAILEAERRIGEFGQIAKDARTTIPQIQQALEHASTVLAKSLVDTAERNQLTIKANNEAVDRHLKAILTASDKLNAGVDQTMQNTAKNIQRLVDENQQTLSKKVEEMDRMLGEELKKSLSSLGTQLASLSGKFVEDYTPLTERLRELVQLAGSVPRGGNGHGS